MANLPVSRHVLAYAKAARIARTLSAAGQPVPPHITTVLVQAESLYASAPANVRANLSRELAHANLAIDNEQIAAQRAAEENTQRQDAVFRDTLWRKASGGHGEEDVRKMAQGVKFLPVNAHKKDEKGNLVKYTTTRAPSDAERRRAQMLLAAEKHGFGNELAKDYNGGRIAELKQRGYGEGRRGDVADALDIHETAAHEVAAETWTPPPETRAEDATNSYRHADIESAFDTHNTEASDAGDQS